MGVRKKYKWRIRRIPINQLVCSKQFHLFTFVWRTERAQILINFNKVQIFYHRLVDGHLGGWGEKKEGLGCVFQCIDEE